MLLIGRKDAIERGRETIGGPADHLFEVTEINFLLSRKLVAYRSEGRLKTWT